MRVKGIYFKKEICVKWNQGNLFSEGFFWISVVAKEYERSKLHVFQISLEAGRGSNERTISRN